MPKLAGSGRFASRVPTIAEHPPDASPAWQVRQLQLERSRDELQRRKLSNEAGWNSAGNQNTCARVAHG